MNRPQNLSKEQLIAFSGEHLYYEIKMLYGVTEKLTEEIKDFYVYNAMLESFVIHASVVLDFFYKLPMNPHEAKAEHFIKDLIEWKNALPHYDKFFNRFNKKRNREVMHLTYARLEVAPEDKRWYSQDLVESIKRIVDLFLDHADPELISSNLYELRSQK